MTLTPHKNKFTRDKFIKNMIRVLQQYANNLISVNRCISCLIFGSSFTINYLQFDLEVRKYYKSHVLLLLSILLKILLGFELNKLFKILENIKKIIKTF